MKSKLAFLMLFTSIISVTQFCFAGQTKYAPIIQAHKATVFGSVVKKTEWNDNFILTNKSIGEAKLVSVSSSGP